RGFNRGPLSWLSPSLGSVDSLQPINATPPDLRDEMCGPHRKRPAAEDADDENESSGYMLSNLPPSAGKASALLKERPDAVKAIAVFVGAAKSAAEQQFANARAKIQKLAKGRPKADANATAAAPPQPATDAKATTPALQTVSSPPAGAFTPSSQPQRALRALPTATDMNNPSAMSYAPAKIEPAPLTAVPEAKPATATAAARAPKSKKKPEAKPATAAKPTTAAKPATAAKPTTASKPAAAKSAVAAKPAATTKQAANAKPATASKQAARKQDASTKQ
ncbi:MAG: D-alanyl-D-alanine carboxypeptidase, partial [Alphaproteobacteria bacterium]|nr:D-alanyl-D-alanine carboxypeptidase [Alphaproteobacteria bacterium]